MLVEDSLDLIFLKAFLDTFLQSSVDDLRHSIDVALGDSFKPDSEHWLSAHTPHSC